MNQAFIYQLATNSRGVFSRGLIYLRRRAQGRKPFQTGRGEASFRYPNKRRGPSASLCGWLPRSFQWTNRHTTITLFIPRRRVHPLDGQGESFFPGSNLRRRGLRSRSQRSCVTLFFARNQQSASLESKTGPFFSSLLVSLSGERRYAVAQGAALCLSKRAAHAAADVVFVHRTSGKRDRGV